MLIVEKKMYFSGLPWDWISIPITIPYPQKNLWELGIPTASPYSQNLKFSIPRLYPTGPHPMSVASIIYA